MSSQVGTAVIKLSFDGKEAVAKVKNIAGSMASAGKDAGVKFASAWTVAAGNLIADGVKKVGSIISGAMDSAMGRIDTLENFPKVMQSLGYSAEESASSIQLIGDKLDGLPTSLDGMASDVQKLAATMGNLNQGMVNATSVGLSLNNMFLAGGKGTEAASAAMEQYNQMLARGKVDMQSWNSMVNAAPGQMNQLAKSLLGANANQQDLYKAMQSGKVTFDQFNEALVKLNEEGGEGFASFTDQAIAATGGFKTALQNIKTSLTKVVASALQDDYEGMVKGTEQLVKRITKTLPKLVYGFTMAFDGLSKTIPQLITNLAPAVIEAVYDISYSVIEVIPQILNSLRDIVPLINQWIDLFITNVIEGMPGMLSQAVSIIASIIRQLFPKILEVIQALLPEILLAIENLVIIVANDLPGFIKMVSQAIIKAAPLIMSTLGTIMQSIVDLIPTIGPDIIQTIITLGQMVVQQIPNIMNMVVQSLMNAIPLIVQGIVASIPIVLEGFKNLLRSFIQAIPQILPEILNGITEIVIQVAMALTDPEMLTLILQAAITLLTSLVQSIPTIIVRLLERLPDIIMNIVKFLTDPNNIGMIINGAIQLFFGIVKAVPQILGALLGAFGNLVGNLWNWITQKFGEFAANFGNFIGGIFKRAINGVLSFIENFINGPIDLINGAIDLINNIPGVDIGHVPRVYLPRLAQGGVTTGATTAIIGEAGQEVVLPLQHNQDNWAGVLSATLVKQMNEDESIGNRPIQVTMNNYIENEMDAEDIGRKLMTSIRRAA